jgi:photosystem II stability/assembly factor-like uncharacterized protein
MRKILLAFSLVISAFILSGCSLGSLGSSQISMTNATVIKSEDGGGTWNPKIKIDDKKTISGVNVLSMAINPSNPNIIYIGTESNGLFVTKNEGETWTQVAFADKAYGLAFDPQSPDIIYGSGVNNGRAKIYKRLQEGQEWKEIYTEPSDGTTISTIAIDKFNSQIVYAGTSAGVIIKSTDGGQTWASLKKADGPIINIAFDAASDAHVYFGVFQTGVLETKDGGTTIDDITKSVDTVGSADTLYTLVADPSLSGVVYIGTGKGVFRRAVDGSWSSLSIIESSKSFPIRAIAVNPRNSKELMYSSAKAIYKSTDGGSKWATFQLGTTKEISVIRYDTTNAAKIYAGLRSF